SPLAANSATQKYEEKEENLSLAGRSPFFTLHASRTTLHAIYSARMDTGQTNGQPQRETFEAVIAKFE
ncbi:hypothetical protein D6V36_19410, partial [Vibrio cholerae]|nr:hypothetical protein [Vibrio cholerae]